MGCMRRLGQSCVCEQPGTPPPPQDGSALVHVQGHLAVSGAAAGPGNPPVPFTEVFVLSRSGPGDYYVASQVFRMLQ